MRLQGESTPVKYKWVRASDGVLAGVCKGLSQTLGIETWILRVIWLVALLWFGSGLVLYLILAVSLPRVDKLDHALDSKVLGVCARIASRYQIEVGLVRMAAVFLALTTFGAAVLAYVLGYIFLPKTEPK